MTPHPGPTDRTLRIAIGSVVVACAVLALKIAAWGLTGSVALLADALESVVNVAAAVAALAAVHYAALPADANHPYGHTKVEYFSAVLEGALIVIAAVAILHEAWGAYQRPRAPDQAAIGLLISAAATAVNAGWASVLFRQGRRSRSPALVAAGHHLMSDVVTSGGVIIGVGLVALTGKLWIDPAAGRADRAEHPLVRRPADAGKRRRADGRGGGARPAGPHPHRRFHQWRWRDRGA